jgi:predicted flap endonuclease-1-like 5' DNA nuclease
MATELEALRGASSDLIEKLNGLSIKDSEGLVEAAATPAQRTKLATSCGCDTRTILELANRADLARVKGVSGVYSDLLENAGVDTVKELATRNAANLHAKLVDTNTQMQLTQRVPTAEHVEQWIEQAKALPKLLQY